MNSTELKWNVSEILTTSSIAVVILNQPISCTPDTLLPLWERGTYLTINKSFYKILRSRYLSKCIHVLNTYCFYLFIYLCFIEDEYKKCKKSSHDEDSVS